MKVFRKVNLISSINKGAITLVLLAKLIMKRIIFSLQQEIQNTQYYKLHNIEMFKAPSFSLLHYAIAN